MKPVLHEVDADLNQATKSDPPHLLTRVRAVMGALELDCRCRGKVDAALERFETLETRRQLRGLILDARHQAERIAALLERFRRKHFVCCRLLLWPRSSSGRTSCSKVGISIAR
ncbi:hypothetical protein [Microvirga brassicacearum]|uniref:hypothetical protein n=1 Tax=Microvirga brassicacearum TaxID=2580413 RepID=UPI001243CE05|nr:hypothetical protein [Microvirga brassicacearum]